MSNGCENTQTAHPRCRYYSLCCSVCFSSAPRSPSQTVLASRIVLFTNHKGLGISQNADYSSFTHKFHKAKRWYARGTHTHAHTHARTHTRTHTYNQNNRRALAWRIEKIAVRNKNKNMGEDTCGKERIVSVLYNRSCGSNIIRQQMQHRKLDWNFLKQKHVHSRQQKKQCCSFRQV